MKNNWEELHVEYTDLFRLKTDLQIELLCECHPPLAGNPGLKYLFVFVCALGDVLSRTVGLVWMQYYY